MNKPRNKQFTKNFSKKWNNDKKVNPPQKEKSFFDYFNPAIEVRNGDVGKALRILKKRLERDDFQKELAKQQYYEKPSEGRRRKKAQAAKRWKKTVREAEAAGEYIPYMPTGMKHLKSKRKTRKIRDYHDRIRQMRRSQGQFD